jgi:hypothetical protein
VGLSYRHALVAQGIEHRFPKPIWGVLRTKAKRRKALLCLRFRLSSSLTISHVFTPVAAQVRPKSGPELQHSKRAATSTRRGTSTRIDRAMTWLTTRDMVGGLGSGGKEIGERYLDKIALNSDAVSGDRCNALDDTRLCGCVAERMCDVGHAGFWD